MRGFPLTSTIPLGLSSVSGRRRVPLPAASTTAFMIPQFSSGNHKDSALVIRIAVLSTRPKCVTGAGGLYAVLGLCTPQKVFTVGLGTRRHESPSGGRKATHSVRRSVRPPFRG